MATERGTSIGRTVTLLLIFAVTVVVIVIIFAYFNGLFKFVSEGTGSVSISGLFALSSSGSTSGNLAIQITDTGNVPVSGIALSCPVAQFATQNCSGLQMNYKGILVSSTNTLTRGDLASGAEDVLSASGNNFKAGTVYLITVDVTFTDGSTSSQTIGVAAQA